MYENVYVGIRKSDSNTGPENYSDEKMDVLCASHSLSVISVVAGPALGVLLMTARHPPSALTNRRL